MRLSATIIAQDEERALPDCLLSLRGLCDEVLVVDGGSHDRTREVARSAGARVLERPFDDFARQHEFARGEARGEWILSIDADERASAELREVVWSGAHAAYALPFKNHLAGVWLRHGGLWPDRHVRLFQRARCRYDLARGVHEKLIVDGSTGSLDAPILHYSWESAQDALEKSAGYGERAALLLHQHGKRGNIARQLSKPLWRFLRGYVLRAGFLDGRAGAAVAWARAYEAWVRERRLRTLR